MPNKICPKCQASKHVRVSKCDCGYAFYATKSEKIIEEKPKTEIKTETKTSGGFLSIIKNKESEIDHDSPGRGKKQCVQCKKYVGGVLKECNLCGFNFENKPIEDKPQYEIKTFDGPGKGRKQCTKCKNYVGVRTTKCGCGHEFATEDKKEDKKPRLLPVVQSVPIIPIKPSFLSIVKKVNEQEEKEKNKEEKKLTKFKMTGQGRKVCPECHSIIPVATRNCDCGHFFEKKEKSEPWLHIEKPTYDGEYIIYDIANPFASLIQISIENENQREYLIEIKNNEILNCEEIDAELLFLNEQEMINKKSPEEIISFLKERFKIENISWRWVLSDSLFEEEKRIPYYLRYNRVNRKRFRGEALKSFAIERNEFLKRNKIINCFELLTPNYRIDGKGDNRRTVILKEKSYSSEKINWIMPNSK